MSDEPVLWVALAAYGIHMLEEHELNWRDWARTVLRLPVDWRTFYVVNAIVVVLGVCCAAIGWRMPWLSLSFPALMLINATLFHLLPTVARRVYSPGLATAIVLFLPVAAWAYLDARAAGVLSASNVLASSLLGAALMAFPIVLLRIKHRRLFNYSGG